MLIEVRLVDGFDGWFCVCCEEVGGGCFMFSIIYLFIGIDSMNC